MVWRWIETPYVDTVTCRFEGDNVFIDKIRNVSFGAKTFPRFAGRLVTELGTQGTGAQEDCR
ncbi:hypothetical protein [Paenibacillus yonginensis]|uniref:hypothetical protein n=1 Tax=Paenibacillus yonginensis TaxID=1462996 RepID=UPI001471828B|nr:hypothetical protein [Paenibacillus yonginensis]